VKNRSGLTGSRNRSRSKTRSGLSQPKTSAALDQRGKLFFQLAKPLGIAISAKKWHSPPTKHHFVFAAFLQGGFVGTYAVIGSAS
jgi:hypothetical protein